MSMCMLEGRPDCVSCNSMKSLPSVPELELWDYRRSEGSFLASSRLVCTKFMSKFQVKSCQARPIINQSKVKGSEESENPHLWRYCADQKCAPHSDNKE
mmetsp:Transcript_20638/g.49593  ORF Transcript_20638/g.49593 Transcript_20638/m.49593 type:complete len:99 (-) Transcript_20638:64-360(-)